MICSLRGVVTSQEVNIEKQTADVVIEVAGVGYLVTVPASAADTVGHGETLWHIYHHITETDQRLFGFQTSSDRAAFKSLLGAHGVGPALALGVLATYPTTQLARIIELSDVDALCEIPGVGKKTAQRLLMELRNSVNLEVIDLADLSSEPAGTLRGPSDALNDVRVALEQLDYSPSEIRVAVSEVADRSEHMDAGELLKLALRSLGGK